MAFISLFDYKTQIRDARLIQMTDTDLSILPLVDSEAVAIVKNRLSSLYDTEGVFAQTGANRDPLVLLFCKRIALYILHGRLPNAMIPPHIKDDYESTMAWLKAVSEGKTELDLPHRQSDTDGDGIVDTPTSVFKWGSQPKRSV